MGGKTDRHEVYQSETSAFDVDETVSIRARWGATAYAQCRSNILAKCT